MVRNRANRMLALAAAATVVAVVGCQTVAPNNNQESVLNPNAGGNSAAATNPNAGANNAQPADVNTGVTTVTNPELLLNAKPMTVKASEGGVYVSADGQLQAQIPPGALTGDAEIRLARVDTSKMEIKDGRVPGIRFQVDLGGATLAPGTTATVTSKVDDRFVDNLKAADPNFTPDKYNLVSDGKGGYGLKMPLHGPAVRSAEPVETTVSGPFLEEGGFTTFPTQLLGGGLAALGGRQAIETYCDVNYCWHGVVHASQACRPLPPPRTVAANCFWVSDDTSLNNQPAQGVTASFSMPSGPNMGPTGAVSGANGKAASYAREGEGVTIRTSFDQPVAIAGNPGSGSAGFEYRSNLTLNSPHVVLKFQSQDQNLENSVKVTYTINGGAPVTVNSGDAAPGSNFRSTFSVSGKSGELAIRIPVPGNSRYGFSITNIEQGSLVAHPSTYESIKNKIVHRNGNFSFNVSMISNQAK